MMCGSSLIHVGLCLTGIALALYASHVEYMITGGFGNYTPTCDSLGWGMSCSRVFTSPYSHILSYWGIVQKGSTLDLSLPHLAIPYFFGMLTLPLLTGRFRVIFRILSYLSISFNVYLFLILKFKLNEFCPVCVSNYIINFLILFTVHRLTRKDKLE
jgi:uncharacterized membrane protein